MSGRVDLPPSARGTLGLRLTAAAARGEFALPVCDDCGAQQYPPRERCGRCLSDRLSWRAAVPEGTLLALTMLHHSNEPYFSVRLPRRTGLVQLDGGGIALAHVSGEVAPGARVRLLACLDRAGQGVLVAGSVDMQQLDEGLMDEFGYPLKDRRVAVSGPAGPYRDAILQQLLAAGVASVVLLGETANDHADTRVRTVPVRGRAQRLADAVGPVDRLIHAPAFTGLPGAIDAAPADTVMRAITQTVTEPLAVSEALRASLRAQGGAVLHVLSVFGRCHLPALGVDAVAAAAAVSAVEGLRASLQPDGVRVLTVFCGPPVDGPTLPLPPAPPQRVARAVIDALAQGLEESMADPAAEDVAARLREDPKMAERALAALCGSERNQI